MYVPVCVQGFSVACTHLKREREGDYFIEEGNRAPVIKATHSRNWGGSVPFAASGTVTPLASGYPIRRFNWVFRKLRDAGCC